MGILFLLLLAALTMLILCVAFVKFCAWLATPSDARCRKLESELRAWFKA